MSIPPVMVATGAAVLAIIWKAVLLSQDAFPFNADEAIVGLMARHILEGEWPIFFYGQAYLGSLDATFVAGMFSVLGDQVGSIRIVQVLLYSLTTFSSVFISYKIYRSTSAALITGLLMSIPTVNVTLYTTVSLGGYGEALLLGNLLLLLTLTIDQSPNPRRWALAIWGFLAGFAFWVFGLTLVFILPSAFFVARKIVVQRENSRRVIDGAIVLFFGILGATPWLVGMAQIGLQVLVEEMLGSAISGLSGGPVWIIVYEHLRNLVLFGISVIFGLRAPWTAQPLLTPLLPVVLVFWMGVLWIMIYGRLDPDSDRIGRRLLMSVVLVLLVGFMLTPFGADPSGRYFVPLIIPLSLFAGGAVDLAMKRVNWVFPIGGLILVIVHNLLGTLLAAWNSPPRISTQFDPITRVDHSFDEELMEFLLDEGERLGYSNYWVSYPLAFLSEETLLFTPRLPYHLDFRYTTRDDRYPAYGQRVEQADRVAYITTNHPELDDRLREGFDRLGVTWKERRIGGYQVFYHLSERVDPWKVQLGEDYP